MADYATTTNQPQFDAALVDYKVAKVASDAVADQPASRVRDQINDLLDDARRTAFAVPVPRLGVVADKLTAYWGEQLFRDEGGPAAWRQTAVGDIRRIEMQFAGIQEPDATGGTDMAKVTCEWNDAVQQYDNCVELLNEVPTDELRRSDHSDIEALMHEAEVALISLPAPDLLAVITKLEILLTDERFNPVAGAAEHLIIMRDLRRFALTPQQ